MTARTIVILGDGDIRAQVRSTLKDRRDVKILGELCALQPRHLGYIEEMAPEMVILDCSSRTLNPLIAVAELARLHGKPRVIAVLADGGAVDFRAVARMDAASVVTTPQALLAAVLGPIDPTPAGDVAA